MEKLGNEVKLHNIGYPVIATLVIRTRKKAIYYRDDGIYEVFRIKVRKAGKIFGKFLPEREVYPGNEDFGFTAWTYRDKAKAFKKYDRI